MFKNQKAKSIATSEFETKKYTVSAQLFKGDTISIHLQNRKIISTTKIAFVTQKDFLNRFEMALKNTLSCFYETDQFKDSVVKFKIKHGMCTAKAHLNLYTKVITKIPLYDELENFGSVELTLEELSEIYEILKKDNVL